MTGSQEMKESPSKFPPISGNYRSSHRRCSVRKGVLRNFAKFTGKNLCLRSEACILLKERLRHRCFPVNLAKFLRTPFL